MLEEAQVHRWGHPPVLHSIPQAVTTARALARVELLARGCAMWFCFHGLDGIRCCFPGNSPQWFKNYVLVSCKIIHTASSETPLAPPKRRPNENFDWLCSLFILYPSTNLDLNVVNAPDAKCWLQIGGKATSKILCLANNTPRFPRSKNPRRSCQDIKRKVS